MFSRKPQAVTPAPQGTSEKEKPQTLPAGVEKLGNMMQDGAKNKKEPKVFPEASPQTLLAQAGGIVARKRSEAAPPKQEAPPPTTRPRR